MIDQTLQQLPQMLRRGDFAAADTAVRAALDQAPDHGTLNAFAAFIAHRSGKPEDAVMFARRAAEADAGSPRPIAQAANLLAQLRLFDEALAAAKRIDIPGTQDPVVLDQLGACFTACEAHRDAETAYQRLVEIVPEDPRCAFNLAASQRFNGHREAAAANFERAAKGGPVASEAMLALSLLQTATATTHHLEDLDQRLASPGLDPLSRAQLFYAKGKELEDLRDWQAAFESWSSGANLMRSTRPWSVEPELAAMKETIRSWPEARTPFRAADLTPVFIVSLPRAGSTLIDRVLSSHSGIRSAGETEDFIVSLLAEPALADLRDPVSIAAASGKVDIAAVGARYRDALRRRGHVSGHVIDKTPTNFLYAGLIAEALPEARIIHVRRNPMDAAIATFKTLFRDRYFWSYDIDTIGSYFLAYQELMTHWETRWADRITSVQYEHLVEDVEGEARRLVDYLALGWEAGCLDFAGNTAPVSTASADQVRRPVYSSSIGHWRHFEQELQPLCRRFEKAGLI